MGHSSRKHSLFGPSSAERWLECLGSVELAKSAPPQQDSPWALEGTRAHECLEYIVKRYEDRRSAKQEALSKWPGDMVEHCLSAADIIFSPKIRPSPEAELMTEQRVVLKSAKQIFGTLDYAWVDYFGVLTVVDFKYGVGVTVFAENEQGEPNPQLMLYAAALASKFNFDFEMVRIAIIQPRVWAADEDPISIRDVSIKELKAFIKKVEQAVQIAMQPGAPLKSGSHCRWCPSASTCPENSTKALAKAHIAFDIEEGVQAKPDTMLLTAETLPRILEACDELEIWIRAARARAQQLAESGVTIPGYKLVPKRAVRVWLPGAESAAAAKWQLDAYHFEKKFRSPAQLEKLKGKEAKEFAKEFTASVSSGANLVRENDKRPELPSVSSDFDFEDDDDEFVWS